MASETIVIWTLKKIDFYKDLTISYFQFLLQKLKIYR